MRRRDHHRRDPVELAARLCRDRGRVVVVGDVGIDIPRAPYYEKELELRLSRSYGPGRYDREYEHRGLDYPIAYVRWTERRNMEAFVELVAAGKVDLEPLVGRRLPVADAPSAYDGLMGGGRSPLGIVLQYGETVLSTPPAPATSPSTGSTTAGVIGAGSFAQRILIPALTTAGFSLHSVASAHGLSAVAAAERFGFEQAVTVDELLADPQVGLAVIATRHASHTALATAALRAGKAVFVEKPPSMTADELDDLRQAQSDTGLPLAVGFNRRHAPLAVQLRNHVRASGRPIEILYRINAGPLPDDHWLNDLEDGGGRLVGEGCHFVDLVCWLVGRGPSLVSAHMRAEPGHPIAAAQSFTIGFEFPDGSVATILYSASGAPALGKEYLEAHFGGRSAVLDDYRLLELSDGRKRRRIRDRGADKGHVEQFRHLRRVLSGETADDDPSPLESMAATLAARQAALGGGAVAPEGGP